MVSRAEPMTRFGLVALMGMKGKLKGRAKRLHEQDYYTACWHRQSVFEKSQILSAAEEQIGFRAVTGWLGQVDRLHRNRISRGKNPAKRF